jgi:hypothetical protein
VGDRATSFRAVQLGGDYKQASGFNVNGIDATALRGERALRNDAHADDRLLDHPAPEIARGRGKPRPYIFWP